MEEKCRPSTSTKNPESQRERPKTRESKGIQRGIFRVERPVVRMEKLTSTADELRHKKIQTRERKLYQEYGIIAIKLIERKKVKKSTEVPEEPKIEEIFPKRSTEKSSEEASLDVLFKRDLDPKDSSKESTWKKTLTQNNSESPEHSGGLGKAFSSEENRFEDEKVPKKKGKKAPAVPEASTWKKALERNPEHLEALGKAFFSEKNEDSTWKDALFLKNPDSSDENRFEVPRKKTKKAPAVPRQASEAQVVPEAQKAPDLKKSSIDIIWKKSSSLKINSEAGKLGKESSSVESRFPEVKQPPDFRKPPEKKGEVRKKSISEENRPPEVGKHLGKEFSSIEKHFLEAGPLDRPQDLWKSPEKKGEARKKPSFEENRSPEAGKHHGKVSSSVEKRSLGTNPLDRSSDLQKKGEVRKMPNTEGNRLHEAEKHLEKEFSSVENRPPEVDRPPDLRKPSGNKGEVRRKWFSEENQPPEAGKHLGKEFSSVEKRSLEAGPLDRSADQRKRDPEAGKLGKEFSSIENRPSDVELQPPDVRKSLGEVRKKYSFEGKQPPEVDELRKRSSSKGNRPPEAEKAREVKKMPSSEVNRSPEADKDREARKKHSVLEKLPPEVEEVRKKPSSKVNRPPEVDIEKEPRKKYSLEEGRSPEAVEVRNKSSSKRNRPPEADNEGEVRKKHYFEVKSSPEVRKKPSPEGNRPPEVDKDGETRKKPFSEVYRPPEADNDGEARKKYSLEEGQSPEAGEVQKKRSFKRNRPSEADKEGETRKKYSVDEKPSPEVREARKKPSSKVNRPQEAGKEEARKKPSCEVNRPPEADKEGETRKKPSSEVNRPPEAGEVWKKVWRSSPKVNRFSEADKDGKAPPEVADVLKKPSSKVNRPPDADKEREARKKPSVLEKTSPEVAEVQKKPSFEGNRPSESGKHLETWNTKLGKEFSSVEKHFLEAGPLDRPQDLWRPPEKKGEERKKPSCEVHRPLEVDKSGETRTAYSVMEKTLPEAVEVWKKSSSEEYQSPEADSPIFAPAEPHKAPDKKKSSRKPSMGKLERHWSKAAVLDFIWKKSSSQKKNPEPGKKLSSSENRLPEAEVRKKASSEVNRPPEPDKVEKARKKPSSEGNRTPDGDNHGKVRQEYSFLESRPPEGDDSVGKKSSMTEHQEYLLEVDKTGKKLHLRVPLQKDPIFPKIEALKTPPVPKKSSKSSKSSSFKKIKKAAPEEPPPDWKKHIPYMEKRISKAGVLNLLWKKKSLGKRTSSEDLPFESVGKKSSSGEYLTPKRASTGQNSSYGEYQVPDGDKRESTGKVSSYEDCQVGSIRQKFSSKEYQIPTGDKRSSTGKASSYEECEISIRKESSSKEYQLPEGDKRGSSGKASSYEECQLSIRKESSSNEYQSPDGDRRGSTGKASSYEECQLGSIRRESSSEEYQSPEGDRRGSTGKASSYEECLLDPIGQSSSKVQLPLGDSRRESYGKASSYEECQLAFGHKSSSEVYQLSEEEHQSSSDEYELPSGDERDSIGQNLVSKEYRLPEGDPEGTFRRDKKERASIAEECSCEECQPPTGDKRRRSTGERFPSKEYLPTGDKSTSIGKSSCDCPIGPSSKDQLPNGDKSVSDWRRPPLEVEEVWKKFFYEKYLKSLSAGVKGASIGLQVGDPVSKSPSHGKKSPKQNRVPAEVEEIWKKFFREKCPYQPPVGDRGTSMGKNPSPVGKHPGKKASTKKNPPVEVLKAVWKKSSVPIESPSDLQPPDGDPTSRSDSFATKSFYEAYQLASLATKASSDCQPPEGPRDQPPNGDRRVSIGKVPSFYESQLPEGVKRGSTQLLGYNWQSSSDCQPPDGDRDRGTSIEKVPSFYEQLPETVKGVSITQLHNYNWSYVEGLQPPDGDIGKRASSEDLQSPEGDTSEIWTNAPSQMVDAARKKGKKSSSGEKRSPKAERREKARKASVQERAVREARKEERRDERREDKRAKKALKEAKELEKKRRSPKVPKAPKDESKSKSKGKYKKRDKAKDDPLETDETLEKKETLEMVETLEKKETLEMVETLEKPPVVLKSSLKSSQFPKKESNVRFTLPFGKGLFRRKRSPKKLQTDFKHSQDELSEEEVRVTESSFDTFLTALSKNVYGPLKTEGTGEECLVSEEFHRNTKATEEKATLVECPNISPPISKKEKVASKCLCIFRTKKSPMKYPQKFKGTKAKILSLRQFMGSPRSRSKRRARRAHEEEFLEPSNIYLSPSTSKDPQISLSSEKLVCVSNPTFPTSQEISAQSSGLFGSVRSSSKSVMWDVPPSKKDKMKVEKVGKEKEKRISLKCPKPIKRLEGPHRKVQLEKWKWKTEEMEEEEDPVEKGKEKWKDLFKRGGGTDEETPFRTHSEPKPPEKDEPDKTKSYFKERLYGKYMDEVWYKDPQCTGETQKPAETSSSAPSSRHHQTS